MKTQPTAHNRAVCASGAVAPSGYGFCAGFLRHIVRFPLSQPQKRHIQPGTLCAIPPKIYKNFVLNIDKNKNNI
jgi:hypothetical protein